MEDIAGKYSFRFSGYAMDNNNRPYTLIGSGLFTLMADGKLTGWQSSAVLCLQGQDSKVIKNKFLLSGTYEMAGDGSGTASVTFTPKESPNSPELSGAFDLVMAGSADHIWITSMGGTLAGSEIPITELVSGEAIRLSAA